MAVRGLGITTGIDLEGIGVLCRIGVGVEGTSVGIVSEEEVLVKNCDKKKIISPKVNKLKLVSKVIRSHLPSREICDCGIVLSCRL